MGRLLFNIVLPAIGVFIAFVVQVVTDKRGCELIFLLPVIYSVYLFCDRGIYTRALNNIGYGVFVLVATFRYFFSPLFLALSDYNVLYGLDPPSTYYSQAVWLLLYEEVIVFLFLFFLKRKFYVESDLIQVSPAPIKRKRPFLMMTILGLFVVVFMPQMVSDIHFIGNLGKIDLSETIRITLPLAGLFKEIVTLGRLFAVLLIIDYAFRKSRYGKRKFYVLLSVLAIVLNASFITNLSRFGMIMPIISFTYLLMMLFKQQKRMVMRTMFSLVVMALIVISALKFFSEDRNVGGYKSDDIEFWGDTMNMYFMGVRETAVGIYAENLINRAYEGQTYLLFLNDAFSNVIGLSNFTEPQVNSVRLYNYVYFPKVNSVSQIPPNIIEGLYYWGWFLSPLYTVFFIFIFAFLDKKIRHTSNLVQKYALLSGSLYCGLCMMINGAMIISFLFNETLMIILYNKFGNLFQRKV